MVEFNGIKVIPDPGMKTRTYKEKPLTWRERLLSWPWRPWRKTKAVPVDIPWGTVFFFRGNFYCHPDIVGELKETLEQPVPHKMPERIQ